MSRLLLFSLLFAAVAHAEPRKVAIGLHVNDLRQVDVRAQSFAADFYIWLRFSLKDLPDEKIAALLAIEPVNGKFDTKEVIDEKTVGDEKYICYRVTGTFFFMPDLRKYPFDRQSLPLVIESTSLDTDEVVFVDDRASYEKAGEPEPRWGLGASVAVPDYTFTGATRKVTEGVYATTFGDPTKTRPKLSYSRFVMEANFAREYESYAYKILIPLLIILAMAWLVFFLPSDQLDTSASVAMTALLSCMAYNVAVSQNMPDIGYMVLSDKFFIATYVLLLLTLGQVFLSFKLQHAEKEAAAHRANVIARGVFPVLVLALFLAFLSEV